MSAHPTLGGNAIIEDLMRFQRFSIRKKITYGFYLLLALMAGSAVLTYGVVLRVERKAAIAELIEDFFNATLELRRFEKNYFLYRQEKDFQDNALYWQQVRDLYDGHSPELREILRPADMEKLAGLIDGYRLLMLNLHQELEDGSGAGANLEVLEERIRRTGKELTDFGEQTRATMKRRIKTLLLTTRTILLVSMVCLFVVALAIAAFLGRRVVNSLSTLEGYTRKISRGDFAEFPIRDGEREIRSLLTAFNRMVKELRMRQQQLVQSEKLAALGTLLSGVAHELNNPLSNISTSAQILAEELETADLSFQKDLVDQIEGQSDRARDIVRTLLEFSRIKEFHRDRLSLKKLVDETIVLIRGQVPGTITISVDIPEGLLLFADKQRMQQVLLNLVKNGIDAVNGDGQIWISARAIERDDRQGEVEIIIEDNGPGIEAKYLRKIFDPFFTTKDVGQGSGLGLFIVHDIIEWHGGRVSVESRPGLGTSFVIWMPSEAQGGQ